MSQGLLTDVGSFTTSTKDLINANFSQLFGKLLAVGNVYYLNPVNGNDTTGDGSSAKPYKTLATAYAACVSGNNDVVVLIGDGSTTATARVDAAFTWAKNATHLLGICSPTLMSQRARIAPTASTTAFKAFFTVSGNGCIFQNIQWFHGFSTGTTAMICMTVSGSRNVFQNCHFAGMGDAASAADTGSRSLKLTTGGENVFEDCTVGIDTVTRSDANASLELASGTTRNVFRRCIFPFHTSAAGVLGILGTGNACVDRFCAFEDCSFINAIKSASTQMTVLASFTTADPGGLLWFRRSSGVGFTKFGDTNALANSYIEMPAVSASAGGLGVNPS